MFDFPIGAMLDSFLLPTPQAMARAAQIGVKGIQMYSTSGENSPENMTEARIREIMREMKNSGLVFSALCGDLGYGFADKERNPSLIEKSKRILDLAGKLGTNVVTTHIGVVPADSGSERYKIMQEACRELAEYADSVQAHFAIETGPETSAVLKNFLDSLGSKGVSVNLDPANLVMVTGDDPVTAVYNLKDYIVHTHAKDGRRLYYKDPEIVYGVRSALPGEDKGPSYIETPLGTGDVGFARYLKALEEIGYRGFLTIERECGDDPASDINSAYLYLKKIISEN